MLARQVFVVLLVVGSAMMTAFYFLRVHCTESTRNPYKIQMSAYLGTGTRRFVAFQELA
jgi:hypothetical protein